MASNSLKNQPLVSLSTSHEDSTSNLFENSIKRRTFLAKSAAAGLLLGGAILNGNSKEQIASAESSAKVKLYPAPGSETTASDWNVTVNGNPVFVYAARVSAMPFNQVWPGYQRPIDQTEIAGFAYWDMSSPVTVQVTCQRPIENVVIRPLRQQIDPKVENQTITFEMSEPGYLTVEVNGVHQALHLFASPFEVTTPDPQDPKVMYFGPGVHRPGVIQLQSNQTLYIAGGAVVYGAIQAREASGVRIGGRGILDASLIERNQTAGAIVPFGCTDVRIEGIIVRDSNLFGVAPNGCKNIHIADLKLIGFWRYNSDGIDIINTQNATVERCFVRSFDDSLVIKGWSSKEKTNPIPLQDITFSDCVIWNDWGRALEVGAETSAPEINRVTFRNCDVIHNSCIALDIQHGDRAAVHDVTFENIRVEVDEKNYPLIIQKSKEEKYPANPPLYQPKLLVMEIIQCMWSVDDKRGTMRDIRVKDISIVGPYLPESRLRGFDEGHKVENVTIENITYNGAKVASLSEAKIDVQAFTDKIELQ